MRVTRVMRVFSHKQAVFRLLRSVYNACNEACKQIIAADTLHLRKEHIEMLYSENLAEQLKIANDAFKLCRETQQRYLDTPGEKEPDCFGLSFANAIEVIKTQQIMKKLDEIKHVLENS